MSGGSKQAEGPHDKQCPSCGLFYQDKGVSFQMHTASCSGTDDSSTSDDVETTETGTDDVQDDAGNNQSDDPTMGTGAKPDTSDVRELPCGCYEIDISEYPAGNFKCDECGYKFKLS